MMTSNKHNQTTPVQQLRIYDGYRTLFDLGDHYIIPLYQRAYAWGDRELDQLIEDISNVSNDQNYYIGSLVVSKQNGGYEVVDGQQRLTSLYLLFHCLELINEPDTINQLDQLPLTFSCREKSNYTLSHISAIIKNSPNAYDTECTELSICNGIKCLKKILSPKFNKKQFLENLQKVVLYRIEVPENTDLNLYFETMNTRGEQLTQHDILKARLISYLDNNNQERAFFAQLWEACSDMNGYVQMHITSHNNELRDSLFGENWNELPPNSWDSYQTLSQQVQIEGQGLNINEILNQSFEHDEYDGINEDEQFVRFESVIEFPYFLLHTLKVYLEIYNVKPDNNSLKIVDQLLDDQKLIATFEHVIEHGVENGMPIKNNQKRFAQNFIMCLLRTRFLYDQYIIKREQTNDSSDGEWSLKTLTVSWGNNRDKEKRTAYYKQSILIPETDNKADIEIENKNNIMIQSALRVSFTSPRVMHWITHLLIWLTKTEFHQTRNKAKNQLANQAEYIARKAVAVHFLQENEIPSWKLGVHTPHIILNYLDYLLWKEEPNNYNDFVFEFRNSVEHWYPQHPSDGSELWEDVDRFGNLCLLQRNINSKFSNQSPVAKKADNAKLIAKGSLKLRIMSALTKESNGLNANVNWRLKACKEHEQMMIALLRKAVAPYLF